jgi:hypothetical protein
MWDMITELASDRLWIYTGIAGSLFGALCLYWVKDTYIAFWVFSKWDSALDFLINRWGWTWFKHDPNAWKKINPKLTVKVLDLENRIKKLELTKKIVIKKG